MGVQLQTDGRLDFIKRVKHGSRRDQERNVHLIDPSSACIGDVSYRENDKVRRDSGRWKQMQRFIYTLGDKTPQ